MNHILASLTFCLLLSACSHLGIVSADYRQRVVSIQGGVHDTEIGARKMAEEFCEGPAKLINYGTDSAGTYVNNFGGTMIATPIRRDIYTYQCSSNGPENQRETATTRSNE